MNITKDEAVSLYVNDGLTTREIAEKAGCTYRHILYVLRKEGVDTSEKRRFGGYKINTEFFKRWSPEMAYVLGLVLTDGCVYKNTLSISQKDPYILEKVNDVMESTYPIRKRRNNGNSYINTLSIYRKSIVDDLSKYGIVGNKSLTVDFPNVPDKYLSHFIRGVIDGDGWVQDRGYVMVVTSASPLFAYKLHDLLGSLDYSVRIVKQSDAYRVIVSGKSDIIRLGKWIYNDCGDLYLPRKRKRFEVNVKTA